MSSLSQTFLCSDYAPDARLDTYSNADIDDEGEYDELSAAARRAAEMEMARRDRADRRHDRGARAAKRSRAPAFLQDDDDDEEIDPNGGLLAGMKKRTRKQYDERRDIDDAEGAGDVGPYAM
jgi:DNA replication licensing factor MCM2